VNCLTKEHFNVAGVTSLYTRNVYVTHVCRSKAH